MMLLAMMVVAGGWLHDVRSYADMVLWWLMAWLLYGVVVVWYGCIVFNAMMV